MDDMHSQFKDCYVQYSISDTGVIEVVRERNVAASTMHPSVTLETYNEQGFYKVNTGIELSDIAPDTVHITLVLEQGAGPGQSFIVDDPTNLIFCVSEAPCKINLWFKAPLVSGNVQFQMVQE